MLIENMKTDIDETRKNYEFLTFLVFENNIRYGVVQNSTNKLVFLYDFEKIEHPNMKRTFLRYGDRWWWESNQALPIDSFIGKNFDKYQTALVGFSKKNIVEIVGPTFSLSQLYLKRIKKKKIEIVNRCVQHV